jgi:hypothetical protein
MVSPDIGEQVSCSGRVPNGKVEMRNQKMDIGKWEFGFGALSAIVECKTERGKSED